MPSARNLSAVLLWIATTHGAFLSNSISRVGYVQKPPKSIELHASRSTEGRKLTPAQKAIQVNVRKNGSEFDKLKQVAYTAVDGISSVTGKKDTNTKKSSVFEGYADVQKKAKLKKALNDPREIASRPTNSVFDTVKDAAYKTADVASSLVNVIEKTKAKRVEEKEKIPLKRALSYELVDTIPDLNSPNLILRMAAEVKLKNLELEQEAKMKRQDLENKVNNFKQTVYSVGDSINETVTYVKEFPEKTMKQVQLAQDYVNSVPGKIQKTVDDITAIPSKVEAKVYEVQTSIDNTITKTKQTIDDVKAIPSRVKETYESTKKTIDNTVKTVEEVTTNTKVLLGLEKPKPKPPKTPPPKATTTTNVAMQVAGGIASVSGKAFLWIGKSAVDLTFKAAKAGVEAAAKQIESQAPLELPKIDIGLPTIPKQSSTTQTSNSDSSQSSEKQLSSAKVAKETIPTRGVTDTEDLEKQVSEALKLAEEALQTTTATKDFTETQVTTSTNTATKEIDVPTSSTNNNKVDEEKKGES